MNYLFDEYTVRPVGEQDRTYLELLIEHDEYHRERMTPDFFLQVFPGEDAWAVEDSQHNVVFYFKTSTVVRIAIQFTGWHTWDERKRNQRALMRGLRWISRMFRGNGFTEIICDTESGDLRRFLERHMGFSTESTLTLPLTQPRGHREPRTDIVRGEVTRDVWSIEAGDAN